VRVHRGPDSADAARALGARAYTIGGDIHLRDTLSNPVDVRLLAHEVVHTVQQQGLPPAVSDSLDISTPGDSSELEAERASDAMVAGQPTTVGSGAPAERMIARDADKNMEDAGRTGGETGARDAKVQVIMGHSTKADEGEAKAIIKKIDDAESAVAKHPTDLAKNTGGLGPLKGVLVENHQARHVLEQYLATVADSGNFQSEYAASYMATKKDFGTFAGLWQAFEAAGGKLKKGAQEGRMAGLSRDPEFQRARNRAQSIRDELKNDGKKVREGLTLGEKAKSELTAGIYGARAAAAAVTATKKQAELSALHASINDSVSKIMMVGQIASMATTGILAFGSAGIDFDKMVESNPEIAPPDKPASPLAAPDPRRFYAPGTGGVPEGLSSPEDGLGKPNDTRTYSLPSQTLATAKGLGEKGVAALGGPEKMLKAAITMLEQSNIDKIQAQIDAAQEDGNLNKAAGAAADLKAKRLAYQSEVEKLQHNTENLMDHKSQLDTEVKAMLTAAKRLGAGKDLTGALRLVAAGDKFLSQVDITIDLGQLQQSKGKEALSQRYNINAGSYMTNDKDGKPQEVKHAQGPGQLHYWTVAKDKGIDDYVATKHMVELLAAGKESLVGGNGTANSTQFDVGKSVEELRLWKKEVEEKRNQAQESLGLGVAAGKST
jgi:hypothetical protein